MALSWTQARAFGNLLKTAGSWAFTKGGKVVGTPKGQYAVKTSAKKIFKVYKEKGIPGVVKESPKIVTDVTMRTWLKKAPHSFEKKYNMYVKQFLHKHGKDPEVHKAKGVELLSMKEWAKTKTPGVHYSGDMPKFDKMGGFLGQRVSRHIARKVAIGGGFTAAGVAALGFATDKGVVSGYAESPKGHRVEAFSKTLRASNPSGRGGHWAAGGTVRAPKGITAAGGWNVGIGYAEKAGLAHQLGGHLNVSTPYFKTGFKGEEQHAFGLKSRSRRVASIRRAVFGQEQHLGVSKKMNKSQKAKDTLYH